MPEGKLYRAWYRGKGFCAVLMLPLDSFETVGVVVNISNMDNDGRILGWASGYEDGGPRVWQRKFPVMYLGRVGESIVPTSANYLQRHAHLLRHCCLGADAAAGFRLHVVWPHLIRVAISCLIKLWHLNIGIVPKLVHPFQVCCIGAFAYLGG